MEEPIALEMAREYLLDFSWVKAGARAGLGEVEAEVVFNSPEFDLFVSELREQMKLGDVETKEGICWELKRLGYTALKDSDKINALGKLATLMDFEPKKETLAGITPTVNVIIDNGPKPTATPTTRVSVPNGR